jgi:hypothetical protein
MDQVRCGVIARDARRATVAPSARIRSPPERSMHMGKCETCGNDYERSFDVVMAGQTHTFDCFECAIQALAPSCGTCGTRIIGHGVETESGQIFCCSHCEARAKAA